MDVDWDELVVRESEQVGFAKGEEVGLERGKKHGREEAHDLCFELGFAHGVALATKRLSLPSNGKACDALQAAVSQTSWAARKPTEEQMQRVRTRFKILDSRAGLGLVNKDKGDMSF
ncbi:hypothetical protein BASA81_001577 [Batrachochytrium salamandrivorans]|nr:hypothetical protein BASA81_001577 [Batrachochytrium salamandrivorans]